MMVEEVVLYCIIKIFKIKLILTQNKNIYKCVVVYRITAGITSIRDVAALFSPTRIRYKDSCLSDNVVL